MGKNGRPKRNSKITIYVPCEKITVKHHGGIWIQAKRMEKVKQKHQNQRCQNYLNVAKRSGSIVNVPRVYSCAMDALQILKLIG